MENNEIKLIYIEESLILSFMRDCVTFGFLLLCIYVSKDSTWWTFFSGCMMLIYIAALAVKKSPHVKKFKSLGELKEWVNKTNEIA